MKMLRVVGWVANGTLGHSAFVPAQLKFNCVEDMERYWFVDVTEIRHTLPPGVGEKLNEHVWDQREADLQRWAKVARRQHARRGNLMLEVFVRRYGRSME